jgi:hypothetical protein
MTAIDPAAKPELNYYNYFTEVEETFVQLRGAPMMISTIDWALIETWKAMGIPLHIVLRAIVKSMSGYRPELKGGRRVNTLLYCQQEVMSDFRNYVGSQVGAYHPEADQSLTGESATASASNSNITSATYSSPFNFQEIKIFLERSQNSLQQATNQAVTKGYATLTETLQRATARLLEVQAELTEKGWINTETLEQDLTILENLIFQSLFNDTSQDTLLTLKKEAERQLKTHKSQMDKEIYLQTLSNYIANRLRETNSIPRLSLFYM